MLYALAIIKKLYDLTDYYADIFASSVSTIESAIVTELVEKNDPNIAPPT